MARPKIKLKPGPIDKTLEILGMIGVLLLIGLPVYYFSSLPDTIPMHYGFTGKPDGFGGKATIWITPIMGFLMYAGMTVLNKFPHIFNYPVEITPENAEKQYRIATRAIRLLITVMVYFFCYSTYTTIRIAVEEQSGLGSYYLLIFLTTIFGIIGALLYKSLKEK